MDFLGDIQPALLFLLLCSNWFGPLGDLVEPRTFSPHFARPEIKCQSAPSRRQPIKFDIFIAPHFMSFSGERVRFSSDQRVRCATGPRTLWVSRRLCVRECDLDSGVCVVQTPHYADQPLGGSIYVNFAPSAASTLAGARPVCHIAASPI